MGIIWFLLGGVFGMFLMACVVAGGKDE